MKPFKFKEIICFGEVLWDMLPSGAKPGGAPLNVAVHLVKNNHIPLLISSVGNDSEGDRLLQFLINSGLSVDAIQKDSTLPTSKVIVQINKKGNADYEICEPVAWDNIQTTKEIITASEKADLIIYGSLASRNSTSRNTLIELLDSSEAVRLLDVNLRAPYDNPEWVERLIHLSDFVKLNEDELNRIASWHGKSDKVTKLTKWLAAYYKCSDVCVTRGENGALFYTNNEIFEHQGFKVNAVDTVGAGDSFLASLIANISKGVSPLKSLENACATGAFVASQYGAVPDYSNSMIEDIINRNQ